MAMFNSYVKLPEGTHLYHPVLLGHAKETSHSARQPRQIFDKNEGFISSGNQPSNTGIQLIEATS